MEKTTRLKNWEISLLLALCVTLLTGTWANARQAELASNLIRLHVLAVDDSAAEQAVKLKVRDTVIEYLAPELSGVKDVNEAGKIIADNLVGIKKAAQSAAGERKVTVTLSPEYYPTREYGGFSLPAGKYRSLRVILGEGNGHNWWCVVFPPLCLDAAEQTAAQAMKGGDYAIVTGKDGYVLSFRLLELWGELMAKLN